MIGIANRTTVNVIEFPNRPTTIGKNSTQLLYGEAFSTEREDGNYYYGTCTHDDYAGYVLKSDLTLLEDGQELPSHLVHVPTTHIYTEPNFKTYPILSLSYLSRVSVTKKEDSGFRKTTDGNWIFSNHISRLQDISNKSDILKIAKLFLGTPYLYGGRSAFGIDCAGLIQISMIASGYSCPARDCCDQESTIGEAVDLDDIKMGDIVYFKGHVGIMIDKKQILNATSRHMMTLTENLDELTKIYDGIRHVRRLNK